MSKDKKTAEPMDVTAKETDNPVTTNHQRAAWGVRTLIEEVHALFPETPYEVSGYNGRNVGLDVQFDFTSLDSQDRADACTLLILMGDTRVWQADVEDGAALVQFNNNPRTYDSRESFGLADAYLILAESDEGGSL